LATAAAPGHHDGHLDALLDLPPCTQLELVEPAMPVLPFTCVDDVIALALAASPEISEAQHTIMKAQAAVDLRCRFCRSRASTT
jgi:outer membrane protein TolC